MEMNNLTRYLTRSPKGRLASSCAVGLCALRYV